MSLNTCFSLKEGFFTMYKKSRFYKKKKYVNQNFHRIHNGNSQHLEMVLANRIMFMPSHFLCTSRWQ